jgi:hypothetical protein
MRLVIFLLGLRFILSSYILKDKEEEVIIWQEDRSLTWNDFRGVPESRNSVASTYYNINTLVKEDEDNSKIEIKAIFFPTRSWKRKDRNDRSILIHEQKHFDITELFARKLRKKIRAGKYKSFRELIKVIDKLYEENDRAMEICQDEYDRQTDHSRNGTKQREWNKRIEQALNELGDFKEPTLLVEFK